MWDEPREEVSDAGRDGGLKKEMRRKARWNGMRAKSGASKKLLVALNKLKHARNYTNASCSARSEHL